MHFKNSVGKGGGVQFSYEIILGGTVFIHHTFTSRWDVINDRPLRKHDKKAERGWGKSSRLYALVTFMLIKFVYILQMSTLTIFLFFNGLLISI